MRMIKRVLKYCIFSLLAAAVFFYAFTTPGYDEIYKLMLRINSVDITELDELLDDEETADLIDKAKLILIARTGNSKGDLAVARSILNFSSEMKQADTWVEMIPNSEASFLNRYLKYGDEFYLNSDLYEVADASNDNYRQLALLLEESNVINSRSYAFAGIGNEVSIVQQLTNISMMIEDASANPLNEAIAPILNNVNRTSVLYMDHLAKSVEENTSLYKEHFLTAYKELSAAIRAYRTSSLRTYSAAESFCTLYREHPTGTFIAFMDGSLMRGFIDDVAKQTAIFTKRHFMIEAFDYTDGADEDLVVRVVDSTRMDFADAYGHFVYRLSGKEFLPAARETDRYYIRIETKEQV